MHSPTAWLTSQQWYPASHAYLGQEELRKERRAALRADPLKEVRRKVSKTGEKQTWTRWTFRCWLFRGDVWKKLQCSFKKKKDEEEEARLGKKWIWWSWESQLQLDWRNERLITAPRGAGWGPQAHTYCLSFLCGLFQTTSQLEFMITIYNLQVVYFSECTKELSF